MPSSLQLQPVGRTSRVPRRPQHTFAVDVRPWQVVPCFLAPVLPGETMKSLLLQARVVSDPLKNPLAGWWCEFYVWYVKHRDLDEPYRQQAIDMMVDPSKSMLTLGAAESSSYTFNGGTPWTSICVQRVIETYFRDANEPVSSAPGNAMIGQYYAAQISQQSFLDSALTEAAYTQGAPGLVVGADDTITGSEIDQTWILWQQYRAANLTHLTYEEYLATYGIPLPSGGDSARRPELVRFVRDWSYPTNTVNPADGTPTTAVSWAISERADKDRFFREPGFLLGCMCVRPKVYLKAQTGSVSGALKDALSWLPAVMGDNPEYSVRQFAAGQGPIPNQSAAYRIDLKDLFLYGEQFLNFDPAVSGSKPMVSLPTSSLQRRYPSATDADALFKTPTSNFIRVDGIASLNVLGMQVDTSPTSTPGGF